MRPSAPPILNLERLPRPDLEALAAFKLWVEMGIDLTECDPAIGAAELEWILAFLKHGGPHIALAPLDGAALSHARRHRASADPLAA
jgi:hypothetical protein